MFGVGFEEPSHFLRPNGIQRCGIILGCYFGYSINFRAGGLQDGILTSESHNPLAPVSEIAFFWEKKRFTTVLEPFVGQLHFLPSHVHLFSKLLGSSSQHTVYIGHEIFADLAFLSSLNAR